MAGGHDDEYDFYEDETKEQGIVPFLIREKRIVAYVVVFALCTMAFSCIGRQMDEMAGPAPSEGKAGGGKKNPWSKGS